jgi:hypothetical protein
VIPSYEVCSSLIKYFSQVRLKHTNTSAAKGTAYAFESFEPVSLTHVTGDGYTMCNE